MAVFRTRGLTWRAYAPDGIMSHMRIKSLFEESGFSKNPEAYGRFLVDTVASSTAIEIGPVSKRIMRELKAHSRHPQKIRVKK